MKALHEAAARLPKPPVNGRAVGREGRSPEGVDREQRRQPAPKRQHPARAASLAVRARWEAQAQRAKQLQSQAEGQEPGQASLQPVEQLPVPLAKEPPAATGPQGTGPSDGPSKTQTLPHSSWRTLETVAVRRADVSEFTRVPAATVVHSGAQQRGSQAPPQQDGQPSSTLVTPGNVGNAERGHEPRAAPTASAQ